MSYNTIQEMLEDEAEEMREEIKSLKEYVAILLEDKQHYCEMMHALIKHIYVLENRIEVRDSVLKRRTQ